MLFEYLGGHCNLLVLKLSYIAVLISLKLALKCAYTVKGPYNLALGYYFAELYDNALFVVFYLQNCRFASSQKRESRG